MIIKFSDLNAEKPTLKHSLERRARDYSKPLCDHKSLLVSSDERTVTCKKCDKQLEPMEALLILAKGIWWEENCRERKLEYEEKRVSKLQYAAIAHLYEAGITPEKYAERWAKEDARVKEQATIEESKSQVAMLVPKGVA